MVVTNPLISPYFLAVGWEWRGWAKEILIEFLGWSLSCQQKIPSEDCLGRILISITTFGILETFWLFISRCAIAAVGDDKRFCSWCVCMCVVEQIHVREIHGFGRFFTGWHDGCNTMLFDWLMEMVVGTVGTHYFVKFRVVHVPVS